MPNFAISAFSILLPTLYCIFTMSMLEGDGEDKNDLLYPGL